MRETRFVGLRKSGKCQTDCHRGKADGWHLCALECLMNGPQTQYFSLNEWVRKPKCTEVVTCQFSQFSTEAKRQKEVAFIDCKAVQWKPFSWMGQIAGRLLEPRDLVGFQPPGIELSWHHFLCAFLSNICWKTKFGWHINGYSWMKINWSEKDE